MQSLLIGPQFSTEAVFVVLQTSVTNLPPFWEDLLFKLLAAILVVVIFYVASRLTKRLTRRVGKRGARYATLAALLQNVSNIIFIFLAVLTMLSVLFGLSLSAILASLGFMGAGVAFSTQEVLKNIWAGIYILFEQPYKIGDRVQVKDVAGVVERIEIRATNLRTDSGLELIIPNNTMLTEIVTNRSDRDRYQVIIRVRVPAELGLSKTTDRVAEAFKNYDNEAVKPKPSPIVLLEDAFDGKINVRIEFWLPDNSPTQTKYEIGNLIRKALPEADISFV